MVKKGFTIVEVVMVFLLIFGVTFFILPKNLDTTRQARFISKWIQKYSELEYMFSVIKAQHDEELNSKINHAADNNEREEVLLETIKPYLRITSKVTDTKYKQYYMDGEKVAPETKYYFNELYNTSSNEIVGLKWFENKCRKGVVCAAIVFDINGLEKPNKWGHDIFGINVLKDQIDPMGMGVDPYVLKRDCSHKGYGTYCSYYYLIGGKFD